MLRRFVFAMVGLGLATGALAGPKEDLHAAFTRFLAETSFKGATVITTNGRTLRSTVEFQAPDRYRIIPEGHPPTLVVGDTVYMDINGKSMKIAMPSAKMIAQYRDPDEIARIVASAGAEDLGADSVNGVPAHKYRYTLTDPRSTTSMVWISNASGLPIQLQHAGKAMDVTITYSNYGDPSIQISAPN